MNDVRRPWLDRLGTDEASSLKHSIALLISMGGARGTLFCAFLLLLRRMEVGQFGSFFLGYTTLTMMPLLADFGIGQTFIRHIPFYRHTRPDYSRYLHWLFFVLKGASVGLLVLAAWPAIPLAARFLNLQNQQPLLAVAVLGAGVTIFYDYANAVFQITYAFKRFELYLFLRNAVFLVTVTAFIMMRPKLLNPVVLVLCIVAINLALVVSAYPYFSRQWRGRVGQFGEFRSNLVRYSKWLTIAAICFAAYRRTDVYFLSHFRSLHEVGIYSAAVLLVEPVAMISPALFAVFLPKLAAEPTPVKLRRYLRLVPWVCLVIFIGVVVYMGALHLVLPRVGAGYREAFPVAVVLLLGSVALIACNMLCVVFLASDRPEVFGKIAVTLAAFSLLGNWLVVPGYGLMGAAVVYGMAQVIGIVLAVVPVRRIVQQGTFSDQWMREQGLIGQRITAEMAALFGKADEGHSHPLDPRRSDVAIASRAPAPLISETLP